MKKRILCAVLALVILTISCALAEAVKPVKSVTTGTLVKPSGSSNVTYSEKFVISATQIMNKPIATVPPVVTLAPGVTIDPNATVDPNATPVPTVPPTATSVALAQITEVAKEAPVTSYFSEETMAAAVEILPEEFDTDVLQMDEFVQLDAIHYEEDYGDVEAVFEFLTPYEDDQVLLVMIGYVATDEELAELGIEVVTEADRLIWTPMQAEPLNGMVKITFTQDILVKMGERETVMAVLSDGAAEAMMSAQPSAEVTPEPTAAN